MDERRTNGCPPGEQPYDPLVAIRIGAIVGGVLALIPAALLDGGFIWLVAGAILGGGFGYIWYRRSKVGTHGDDTSDPRNGTTPAR